MRRPHLQLWSILWVTTLALLPSTSVHAQSWLGPDWSQRVKLEVQPENIVGGADLHEFTLLLRLEASRMAAVFGLANQDGSDLVVTAGDGLTVLAHELVSYDPVAKEAELWFKADALSSTANVFYLYYRNPFPGSVNASSGAWGSEHLVVYHFDEDPTSGELLDSGLRGYHAKTSSSGDWSSEDVAQGQIGRAWRYNGFSHHVYASNVSSSDSSFTISAWAEREYDPYPGGLAVQSLAGFWDLSFQQTINVPNSSLATSKGGMRWAPDIDFGELHHFVWVLDGVGDTARFFFDGVEQELLSQTQSTVYTGEPINGRIGIASPVYFNTFDLMAGIIDEFRIVEGLRDSTWIVTEYRNQSDPVSFYSYAFESRDGGATAVDPAIAAGSSLGRIEVWPNPFQGAADIRVDLRSAAQSVAIYDVAGRRVRTLRLPAGMDRLLQLRWDGRDERGLQVGSGTYYVRAHGHDGSAGAKILLLR